MPDSQQRQRALLAEHSFIVQAPAGSGKTELLIQRLLVVLARVEQPGEVLAITFTNKAAAEMRTRLLRALQRGLDPAVPQAGHEQTTWQLARAVIERHGESLLENPAQLAIQTIDSLCATLVRRMPWLSRFGAMPEVAEDATELYQTAVRQLFAGLEQSGPRQALLKQLLRHLDNRMDALEQLLMAMLARRDQWLPLVVGGVAHSRAALQQALEGLCRDQLQQLVAAIPSGLASELAQSLAAAAAQLDDADFLPAGKGALPGSDYAALVAWQKIAGLLLTNSGSLRRSVTKNQGFPAGKEHKEAKQKMLELLAKLELQPALVQQLVRVQQLPAHSFPQQQWQLLQALLELLPQLVAELWLVFRSAAQVDFSEIAQKAIAALGQADDPSQLLLQIDQRLSHILVDEFQDTSRLQYQLLERLMAGWQPGDGRTLFLVGDPMQSIYRFREAEVGLFLQCCQEQRFGQLDLPLEALQLQANFRSQQGIVDWVNQHFRQVFPARIDAASGAVPLAPAVAVKPLLAGDACQLHAWNGRDDKAEAQTLVELVRQQQQRDPQQRLAILVRSRSHLPFILQALKEENIAYQAKDLDPLGERPAALDVVHLTRALLLRGDRLSWLALLRAPWCGLTLADLQRLCDSSPAGKNGSIAALLASKEGWPTLSPDGRQRLARVAPILLRAQAQFGQLRLRSLVESCWLSLGAAACYSDAEYGDALRVFELLEKLEEGGDLPSFAALERGLQRLFSQPDTADMRLQIMTIHKAKGLEFDTVILPGLGRIPRQPETPLLRWSEHPRHGLLMAPLHARDADEKDPLYQLVAKMEQEKQAHETARLLYVAVTRARERLFLLAHAREDASGELKPERQSLLETLWPAVADQFVTQLRPSRESAVQQRAPAALRRLPADWQPVSAAPLFDGAAALPEAARTARSASDSDQPVFSGWENPLYRHVGSAVHLWLEKLARQELPCTPEVPAEQRPAIRHFLAASGVPVSQLETACERVIRALEGCLASERGRWILAPHPQHACELPLSGRLDRSLVHAVIDRTFVADGVRWVIDYKNSRPAASETLAAFYQREGSHYRAQLQTYARLFALLNEDFPLRCALYFPQIDGWFVYPDLT